MNKNIENFVNYCKKNLDFNETTNYNYQSLSVCLIDCIYSLRAKYFIVTVPIVERYASSYMRKDKNASGDTLMDLVKHIEECGGTKQFADKIMKNHQKLGRDIPKEEVLYILAQKLLSCGINTMEDFQNFKDEDTLEKAIRSVKGMGDAGTNYLFMLAGNPNRCKPDVHIHHCIKDACGVDVSNQECQRIFKEAVEILKNDYPTLTVRKLDGIIWQKYQAK